MSQPSFIYSITTTLYFIENGPVHNLQIQKLVKHYNNMWCVTDYFLIWSALSGFGRSIIPSIVAAISTITSSPQTPWSGNPKSIQLLNYTVFYYSFNCNSAVSNPLRPCPLRASNFSPSLSTIPCFKRHLRGLWWVLEVFHGVIEKFSLKHRFFFLFLWLFIFFFAFLLYLSSFLLYFLFHLRCLVVS